MSDPKPRIQLSCERGASAAYADAVAAAGGLPCPGYAPEPDLSCVGLVLCGGGDLDPDMFGWPQAGGDPPDRERDVAELALFRAFYQAGRPILGICRGMQLLNIFLGGTLVQDLADHLRPFHQGQKGDAIHPILAQEGSLLHRWYGPVFPVNSHHHQVLDRIGAGLTVTARSEGGCTPTASTTRRWPTRALAWSSPHGARGAWPRPWSTSACPSWGCSSTPSAWPIPAAAPTATAAKPFGNIF